MKPEPFAISKKVDSIQIWRKRTRMITMSKIAPRPPLGPYPQLRLYGQAGAAPKRRSTSKTRRIVAVRLIRC